MSLAEELYKEVILDHYENPRNFGELDPAHIHEEGVNPLCGDELEIFINMDGDKVKEIRFKGKGCSISQASSSMMTEAVEGKSKQEVLEIIKKFKAMITEESQPDFEDDLEELNALYGVKKFPVRVKCAVLSWNTLEKAMND